jgi:hypothetical protein
MVAVRLGQVADHGRSWLVGGRGVFRQAGQRLQEGERTKLERINVERVVFFRHDEGLAWRRGATLGESQRSDQLDRQGHDLPNI